MAAGMTLADARLALAGVQGEIVAAQARAHAARRPACWNCGTACRVKDYRQHAIATLFGQVTVRLPRFRCADCGTTEAGMALPPHVRSTPELDRLWAQFSALMTYGTAAEVLAQLFPLDAGTSHEALRRHTFKVAESLPLPSTVKAATPPTMITLTLDATFIRSCDDGERHLEVRIGNAETATRERQVFGAAAKTEMDLAALIRGNLDVVGRTATTALTAFTDGCPALRHILLEAGQLRRAAPGGVAGRHVADRGYGQLPGEPPDGQVTANALDPGGAERLLQVRCAVYNGTLGSGFGQRFHAANDPYPPVAIAA